MHRVVWLHTFTALVVALMCVTSVAADQKSEDIVAMQKSIYSALGQHTVPEVVTLFLPEFNRLNVDGKLAETLNSLYVMRLLDLQISIDHAKKMRDVLQGLTQADKGR